MAKDNTLAVIGVLSFIFILILVIASLSIFSPAQDNKPLAISDSIQEEQTDLSTLTRQTIDTSICYTKITCLKKLLEEEGLNEADLNSIGLILDCKQIPCYVQGINYHD